MHLAWSERETLVCQCHERSMQDTVNVLFLESVPILKSDSQVHAVLMQYFDSTRVQVHVACTPAMGAGNCAAIRAYERIPRVQVFSTHLGAPVAGQPAYRRVGSAARALLSLGSLSGYIRRNRIDVIHVASRPRDALIAVLLAKMTGAKSLIHLHVAVSDWFSPMIRWCLRQCDGILCISDFVRRSAVAHGYEREKIYCVLNGLVPAEWDPGTDGTAVRREFGIAPYTVVLAIISRLFSWKGHTELLKALALVRESETNFKLLVVGEDDVFAHPGGGSYRKELEALAQQLALTDQVIFTGFRSDVQQVLAACDIFTLPSFEEPLGVAFLEAMAMEKPVIALASGGVPEVVEHDSTGLLSEPGDIHGLAANILALIRDPGLRMHLGTCGRMHVRQRHDPVDLARQTETIYRRISQHDA
jgi:glycosyltransferase involved in cell wall biosynthesis